VNILTVIGARPQFVKAAVVSRAIATHNAAHTAESIDESIVHSGQHYDDAMSRVFFEEMAIPEPVVNLEIGGGSHGAMTGAMLAALEREILQRRPDIVLVYGDTNSTLAGALAAAKLKVPVAHVEAGLRSFNRAMPEEVNRVVADHVAQLLFCPSEPSREQLAREGIEDGVHVVGDVMVDALHYYRAKAVPPQIDHPFVLVTMHRAENTDDPERLRNILAALADYPLPVRMPLHPRTRKAIEREGLTTGDNIHVTEPLSYFEMLGHLSACRLVMTDSGGLQKEAFLSGKKCLTLRDETEWTELVDLDVNRLVGANSERIAAATDWAMAALGPSPPVYGDGTAGPRIVAQLLESVRSSR